MSVRFANTRPTGVVGYESHVRKRLHVRPSTPSATGRHSNYRSLRQEIPRVKVTHPQRGWLLFNVKQELSTHTPKTYAFMFSENYVVVETRLLPLHFPHISCFEAFQRPSKQRLKLSIPNGSFESCYGHPSNWLLLALGYLARRRIGTPQRIHIPNIPQGLVDLRVGSTLSIHRCR